MDLVTPWSGPMLSAVMILNNIDFRKSQSQHPKPSLPSPTYKYFKNKHRLSSLTDQVFKNQHILSMWTVATNSCPSPVIFSWKEVSVLAGKFISSCANHFFLVFLPVILKFWLGTNIWRGKNNLFKCGYVQS